jgi:phosphatidylethanolamine-binding protein (PEBP) family uncharacterized protein
MRKTFKVAQVRDLLNQVYNEKITFSRFVEILNESADNGCELVPVIYYFKDSIKEIYRDYGGNVPLIGSKIHFYDYQLSALNPDDMLKDYKVVDVEYDVPGSVKVFIEKL